MTSAHARTMIMGGTSFFGLSSRLLIYHSSDYNYIWYNDASGGSKCVPSGPERIPSTQCTLGRPDESYMGPSGYRKIPGNKCEGGIRKDERVSKHCSGGEYFRSGGVSV